MGDIARDAEAQLPTVEFQLRRAKWPWAVSHQQKLPPGTRAAIIGKPWVGKLYTAFVLWRCERLKAENPVGFVISAIDGEDAPWTIEPEFLETLSRGNGDAGTKS